MFESIVVDLTLFLTGFVAMGISDVAWSPVSLRRFKITAMTLISVGPPETCLLGSTGGTMQISGLKVVIIEVKVQ